MYRYRTIIVMGSRVDAEQVPSYLSIIALVLASVAIAYQRLARPGARRMRFSIL
jgi:hypothetical protein